MKKAFVSVLATVICLYSGFVHAEVGTLVTSDLWIRAVINTVEKGRVEALWEKGGEALTIRGDRVIWGYFYASPVDVTWGSQNNPDLYVKIWFDVNGRVDVNYFHVSVPDIEVYSEYPYKGSADQYGVTTMSARYIRQYYETGQSYSAIQQEDGIARAGYSQSGNPPGAMTVNNLNIGAVINTVEKGAINAVWRLGGHDKTSRGDEVIWGFFYADPDDVSWGSNENPDLYVKVWFDVSGRIDVNYFHVSVPDIEVYSDYPGDGTYDNKSTTIMDDRYVRHEYSEGGETSVLTLSSSAFSDGQNIPLKYVCAGKGGQNISPDLSWKNIPDKTASLALIVHDPHQTAKNWVHWVVFGISPEVRSIKEGVPVGSAVDNTFISTGAKQIVNTSGIVGYFGPCPPDPPHPYIFTLYALDNLPNFTSGKTYQGLLNVMEGHILDSAKLTGNF